jgi:hypothetical protein
MVIQQFSGFSFTGAPPGRLRTQRLPFQATQSALVAVRASILPTIAARSAADNFAPAALTRFTVKIRSQDRTGDPGRGFHRQHTFGWHP